MPDIDWKILRHKAIDAAAAAYAPYSRFPVGATALVDDGRVVTGCNVENVSYGLSICAERAAVFAMIADGERAIRAIAVVTDLPVPGSPCGACRQVLAEFGDDVADATDANIQRKIDRLFNAHKAVDAEPGRGLRWDVIGPYVALFRQLGHVIEARAIHSFLQMQPRELGHLAEKGLDLGVAQGLHRVGNAV